MRERALIQQTLPMDHEDSSVPGDPQGVITGSLDPQTLWEYSFTSGALLGLNCLRAYRLNCFFLPLCAPTPTSLQREGARLRAPTPTTTSCSPPPAFAVLSHAAVLRAPSRTAFALSEPEVFPHPHPCQPTSFPPRPSPRMIGAA